MSNDYVPGWSVVFPEPERSESAPRPTGPRRTQDDVARCYYCGADTDERPSLDQHTFCSRECTDAWVRR